MSDSDLSIAALGRMLKEYREILTEGNLMDFSSIQIEAYHLLQDNAEILDGLRSKVTHIMVDEYQDELHPGAACVPPRRGKKEHLRGR